MCRREEKGKAVAHLQHTAIMVESDQATSSSAHCSSINSAGTAAHTALPQVPLLSLDVTKTLRLGQSILLIVCSRKNLLAFSGR